MASVFHLYTIFSVFLFMKEVITFHNLYYFLVKRKRFVYILLLINIQEIWTILAKGIGVNNQNAEKKSKYQNIDCFVNQVLFILFFCTP